MGELHQFSTLLQGREKEWFCLQLSFYLAALINENFSLNGGRVMMIAVEKIVYVIDDNPAVRDSIALMLEQDKFKIQLFSNAFDFLEAYQSDYKGCLILDIRMPGMDGIQLQRELLRRQCTLPIIFLTGHGDIPMSVRAVKAGAVDFLTKPVTYDKLLASIRSAFIESAKCEKAYRCFHDAGVRLAKLTKREHDVATMAIQGLSNKEIARCLDISYRTVEIHRSNMMRKVGVRNMLELARIAEEGELERATPGASSVG
jgi:FixJ family two-component response regulator